MISFIPPPRRRSAAKLLGGVDKAVWREYSRNQQIGTRTDTSEEPGSVPPPGCLRGAALRFRPKELAGMMSFIPPPRRRSAAKLLGGVDKADWCE